MSSNTTSTSKIDSPIFSRHIVGIESLVAPTLSADLATFEEFI